MSETEPNAALRSRIYSAIESLEQWQRCRKDEGTPDAREVVLSALADVLDGPAEAFGPIGALHVANLVRTIGDTLAYDWSRWRYIRRGR